MAVAIDQHHGFKSFNRSQRCRLQSFTQSDYNILQLNQANLSHCLKQACEVANVHRSLSTPCFSLTTKVDEEYHTIPRVEIVGGHGAPRVRALVVEVAIAMASGVGPIPVPNGLGGAYFLRSRNGNNIAVAKPIDAEPLALNNSKGFGGGLMLSQPGMKRSVRVGETVFRELAAYLLDHGGFAGVPPTALVKIIHFRFDVSSATPVSDQVPHKIASLQCFVDHDFDAGELGPSGFSVASVHRIGILDVRLLNLDRHAGNIIVKKSSNHENYAVGAAELVPIDHGLCLPEWLDDPYFEWLHWPQALVPLSESELEYISNLDAFKDAELLRSELPSLRESSIRVLILCTLFLKKAAAAGFCLADIGEMMTRDFFRGEENLSVLENLCVKAKASVFSTCSDSDDENKEQMEETGEFEIFQYDSESGDNASEFSAVPQLLQCAAQMGKPPKIPRFPSVRSMPGLHNAALSPPNEKNVDDDDNDVDDEDYDLNRIKIKEDIGDDNSGDGNKVEGLTRSMSYSVQNCSCETECVTLGDMSEREWELFLECFEELLPEVFEGRKCTGLKQRLGRSCQF